MFQPGTVPTRDTSRERREKGHLFHQFVTTSILQRVEFRTESTPFTKKNEVGSDCWNMVYRIGTVLYKQDNDFIGTVLM